MKLDTSKSTVQKIRFPIQENESFHFEIKRDDLIDSVVSGNKWRKLEYNLLQAEQTKKKGILTFGGAYSNHLVATAKACSVAGLKSMAWVRGDELRSESNETLKACAEYGMELVFISRSEYRKKDDVFFLKELASKYPDYYIVPEGGKSYYGVVGCQHILQETTNNYDHVYLAGGTGTTAAGVLLSASEKTKVHVVSALKGAFLQDDIQQLLRQVLNDEDSVAYYLKHLVMINDGHFGGYARVNQELLDFINQVYADLGLKLDPIYTGKAVFAMVKDYNEGLIGPEDKVLFIHTG